MSRIQHIVEATPTWANWALIGGPWLVAVLQPAALFVTVVWGGLQIYGWFEKRRQQKRKDEGK